MARPSLQYTAFCVKVFTLCVTAVVLDGYSDLNFILP
jgi:hypothetical protein